MCCIKTFMSTKTETVGNRVCSLNSCSKPQSRISVFCYQTCESFSFKPNMKPWLALTQSQVLSKLENVKKKDFFLINSILTDDWCVPAKTTSLIWDFSPSNWTGYFSHYLYSLYFSCASPYVSRGFTWNTWECCIERTSVPEIWRPSAWTLHHEPSHTPPQTLWAPLANRQWRGRLFFKWTSNMAWLLHFWYAGK